MGRSRLTRTCVQLAVASALALAQDPSAFALSDIGPASLASPPPEENKPPFPPAVLSIYKDVKIGIDPITHVLGSSVTGIPQPLIKVLPTHLLLVNWAFATGECGSETWGGVTSFQLAEANAKIFANSSPVPKSFILSVGGPNGVFTCGSDAGFTTFVKTFGLDRNISNLEGVDFDIEGGQSQTDIANLVARVKVAEQSIALRYIFSLRSLGSTTQPNLDPLGDSVMRAIKTAGLTSYIINLLAFDFGSAGANSCSVVNGACSMGQSVVAAAQSLHSFYGVPFSQIELTAMIGGDDTPGETFTLQDVQIVARFAKQVGLAGVNFRTFDRDRDCPPGPVSPICNTYGQAGTLGFAHAFLAALGQ